MATCRPPAVWDLRLCRGGLDWVHSVVVVDSIVVEPSGMDVDSASAVFAALAEPVRLRILAVLADGGTCVCDIRSAVPIAENLLAYHLRVLRESGLIQGTRRGRWIDYRLTAGSASLIARGLATAGFDAVVADPSGYVEACEVSLP